MKHDLDRHLLSTECAADTKKLIFEWYVLDENAQPNEYVLRNLTDEDDPAYWAALKLMLPAMRGLPFDAQRHPGLLIGKSVTEWEMRAALGPHPTELDRKTAFLLEPPPAGRRGDGPNVSRHGDWLQPLPRLDAG